MMKEQVSDITTKIGTSPGKTLAVFAGIHGNEKVGILALKQIIDKTEIVSGKVFFVFANQLAIGKNVREVNANLNRLFIENISGDTYEHKRARDLMKILNESDALLDLHASNSKVSKPFIICRKEDLEVASKLGVTTVSVGWDGLVQGSTDAYMSRQNKIGLCVECGSIYETEANLQMTLTIIKQFLSYMGAAKDDVELNLNRQDIVTIDKIITKRTDDFRFTNNFNDFDKLEPGKVFAIDGETTYVAGESQCIIFPRPNKPIGGDVFILGRLN